MGQLFWIHEWVANSPLVDALLAGDTRVCSVVGMLIGAMIAARQVKQQFGEVD